MSESQTDFYRKTHLYYHWWKYVILAVLSVAIWTAVFDTLQKPDRNEKIGIVFFGDVLDVSLLRADLVAAIDSLTQQEITCVDVCQTFADCEHLGQVLMARTYDSDLLILPAELVDKVSAYGFFMPLPESIQYGPVYTQKKDGQTIAYGLEIYKPGGQNRFSSFCSGEQTYYIFLSKESVNFAGLNGNGTHSCDAALRVLEYLLEEPDEAIPEK